MKIGNYLIIKEPSDTFCADGIVLDLATDKKTVPILWCRDGMFCLIPKEIIQNAIDVSGSLRDINLKRTPPKLYFFWNQGIPVSNQAGRALLGE